MTEIKLYTTEEAAQLLKVTRRSIYTYLKSGKLEAVKIGNGWRISQEALEKFLSQGTK